MGVEPVTLPLLLQSIEARNQTGRGEEDVELEAKSRVH
jgi:hypothetical protein